MGHDWSSASARFPAGKYTTGGRVCTEEKGDVSELGRRSMYGMTQVKSHVILVKTA